MRLNAAVCLPREADTVAVMRRVATDALATLGVTAACVDDIRVALSEACTNVVQHASPGDDYRYAWTWTTSAASSGSSTPVLASTRPR